MEDTEFFLIRRNDFDNVLKEEMVKKGDEKLRFLMRHLPGMKEVPVSRLTKVLISLPKPALKPHEVPKPGGKPHTSYIFKRTKFPRGHSFLVQNQVAEQGLWVVYRGAVEFRRAELLFEAPKRRERSLPHLRPLKRSVSQPGDLRGVMSRRGLLVQGGVFGSCPLPAPEPFTVQVSSASCEVFYIASGDFPKMPRRLLEVVQDYVALSTAWRLACHQKSTAFRKSGHTGEEPEPRRQEEVQEVVSSDVTELIEECRKERMCRSAAIRKAMRCCKMWSNMV